MKFHYFLLKFLNSQYLTSLTEVSLLKFFSALVSVTLHDSISYIIIVANNYWLLPNCQKFNSHFSTLLYSLLFLSKISFLFKSFITISRLINFKCLQGTLLDCFFNLNTSNIFVIFFSNIVLSLDFTIISIIEKQYNLYNEQMFIKCLWVTSIVLGTEDSIQHMKVDSILVDY